jgi:hypothetical protein
MNETLPLSVCKNHKIVKVSQLDFSLQKAGDVEGFNIFDCSHFGFR